MPTKGKTPRKNKTPDYAKAAARVLEILNDPTSPQLLVDVLDDMILDLQNECQINSTDPEIARLIMLKGLRHTEEIGLRQMNGVLRTRRQMDEERGA